MKRQEKRGVMMPEPEQEKSNAWNDPLKPVEDFPPGVVITAEGVTLFRTDFRSLALEAGALVDVSEMANQAGFLWPTAVTKALWEDIHAIPEAFSHETVEGRLWDVLSMARLALTQAPQGLTELIYPLILHVEDRSEYVAKIVAGPGDHGTPVLTILSAEQDVDLELGDVVITPGALTAFADAAVAPTPYLLRHQRGDWGELGAEDKAANDWSARHEARVLSAYRLPNTQEKIWIVTEWDRSVTTLLLPSEY